MPIYAYDCRACGARTEVYARRVGAEVAPVCKNCGSTALKRAISAFAFQRDFASQMASLDPVYRKRIDAAIASTPEADPMRLLAKLTPFSAAEAPGDPIDF
jgi:putative FmdB family regulatory protein